MTKLGNPILALYLGAALSIPAAYASTNESIGNLIKRADTGDLKAEVTLGNNYFYGLGVEKNSKEALRWYLLAAAQGDHEGALMAEIGSFYEKGEVVARDPEKAAEWYLKAGELNAQPDGIGSTAWPLLRLSQEGLIKEKYAGYPLEGSSCWFVTKVDETTPLKDLVNDLISHTEELYTGKSYWIGYNSKMLSIAAHGDEAIPYLVDLVTKASSPEIQRAGLLTIHLIGIRSKVADRYVENFEDWHAREALWNLMRNEGITDEIAELLKRDPWPADVPAIMNALTRVKGDCPGTLNALLRYRIEKLPIDTFANSGLENVPIKFVMPEGKFSKRDYISLMIAPLLKWSRTVDVETGLVDQFPGGHWAYGSSAISSTESMEKYLQDLTGTQPDSFYTDSGRPIFFYVEEVTRETDKPVILHLCTSATAKRRLLDWWRKYGRAWYCYSVGNE